MTEIDRLVWLLEEAAERRIDILRVIQAVSLLLAAIIVVITMALVPRRFIRPLRELLSCADRALEETGQEFRVRSEVDIGLDNDLLARLITPNDEIHVLQIVREALSNVIRHANAQHAGVKLQTSGNLVEVEIRDDGRGQPNPGRNERERRPLLGNSASSPRCNESETDAAWKKP